MSMFCEVMIFNKVGEKVSCFHARYPINIIERSTLSLM
jgi:hypothetical protein